MKKLTSSDLKKLRRAEALLADVFLSIPSVLPYNCPSYVCPMLSVRQELQSALNHTVFAIAVADQL